MVSKNMVNKIGGALTQLEKAIEGYKKAGGDNRLQFLALSKGFEVAVEYAWRELKARVEDDGLDAPSPKTAIKQAAKLGLINDAESWLACIDARNDSVHDYFGIPEADYVALAERFLKLGREIK